MTLRTERFMSAASLAAEHVSQMSKRIAAMYAGEDSELTISLDEIHKELQETGHAYDENCQRPACVKWRQMHASAVQQVLSQGQQ